MAALQPLDGLWDVTRGTTARLVYIWTVAEVLEPEEALVCNLVVMLDAAMPGRYPHTLAREWVGLEFDCDEARAWIRAGVLDPVDASTLRANGENPDRWTQRPRAIAI